jgi:hypothetical protein
MPLAETSGVIGKSPPCSPINVLTMHRCRNDAEIMMFAIDCSHETRCRNQHRRVNSDILICAFVLTAVGVGKHFSVRQSQPKVMS